MVMIERTGIEPGGNTVKLTQTLRILGTADVVSGVVVAAAASWLATQLGVDVDAVRAAGAALVVLGIATLVLAARPPTATATVVVEALTALLMIGLVLFADPSSTGIALLVGSALWCAGASLEVTRLHWAP